LRAKLHEAIEAARTRIQSREENTSMAIEKHNQSKPRVLILGAAGRTGSKVIAELERINTVQVVYSSRSLTQVEAWRLDEKDSVLLDLDQPETFPDALAGIDRLFLLTGYTVAMVYQSKTIVDAAADAGVKFIVRLGIFGNGRLTNQYATWHEMVERYIEGSGVAWANLHPHFFMDNLLAAAPVIGGSSTGSWESSRSAGRSRRYRHSRSENPDRRS
jgi:NAD(P)H dehydrogenase (quinone)